MIKQACCISALLLSANFIMAQDTVKLTQSDSLNGLPHDIIFTVVQTPARFPGGLEAWIAFLQENLNTKLGKKYIPLKRNQESAQQVAKVSFIVNTKGDVTDVKVIGDNIIHPKLAEEAIRVIKKSPRWIPAEQNGKKVTYRQIQSVTFEAVWGK